MLHCVHQLCLFTAERNRKTQNYDPKVAQQEFFSDVEPTGPVWVTVCFTLVWHTIHLICGALNQIKRSVSSGHEVIKVSAAARMVFFYTSCWLNLSEPTVSLLQPACSCCESASHFATNQFFGWKDSALVVLLLQRLSQSIKTVQWEWVDHMFSSSFNACKLVSCNIFYLSGTRHKRIELVWEKMPYTGFCYKYFKYTQY